MKRTIEDDLFENEAIEFKLPGEKEVTEAAAWICAQYQDGIISGEKYVKELETVVDDWKRKAEISCVSENEAIRIMTTATIRAREILDKKPIKKMRRKKKGGV